MTRVGESVIRVVALLAASLLPTAALAVPPPSNQAIPTAEPEPNFVLNVDLLQRGCALTYLVEFDNVGAGVATIVVLRVMLPTGSSYAGSPGDIADGAWTRTYGDLGPGPYSESLIVELPSAEGARIVTNLVEIRYVGASGVWVTKSYEHVSSVMLPAPAGTASAWILVAIALTSASAAGGVAVHRRRSGARFEQVFLMHRSGMLIHHWGANVSPARDIDIMSGMLVILKEFVRDSFRGKSGALTELQFGDSRVFLGEGRHAILAAVVNGRHANGLPAQLRAAVQDFEDREGPALEKWSGRLELLPDGKGVVDRLVRGEYGRWRIPA